MDAFDKPKLELEQYCTPPDITAGLFQILQFEHEAIEGKVIGDFCSGTAMYSVASCYFEPSEVVAFEIDDGAV